MTPLGATVVVGPQDRYTQVELLNCRYFAPFFFGLKPPVQYGKVTL